MLPFELFNEGFHFRRAWLVSVVRGEQMAIDPVCGTEVDERATKHQAEHHDKTYFFCSEDCRNEFVGDPEDYVD